MDRTADTPCYVEVRVDWRPGSGRRALHRAPCRAGLGRRTVLFGFPNRAIGLELDLPSWRGARAVPTALKSTVRPHTLRVRVDGRSVSGRMVLPTHRAVLVQADGQCGSGLMAWLVLHSTCLAGSSGWTVRFGANGTARALCYVGFGVMDNLVWSGVGSGVTGSPGLPEPDRPST